MIESMGNDWDPHLQRARDALDDACRALRGWLAGVTDAPVHESAKEAAAEIVAALEPLAEHVAQVNAATRAADAVLWEVHVDNPRPNHQAWTT